MFVSGWVRPTQSCDVNFHFVTCKTKPIAPGYTTKSSWSLSPCSLYSRYRRHGDHRGVLLKQTRAAVSPEACWLQLPKRQAGLGLVKVDICQDPIHCEYVTALFAYPLELLCRLSVTISRHQWVLLKYVCTVANKIVVYL